NSAGAESACCAPYAGAGYDTQEPEMKHFRCCPLRMMRRSWA
ncbi:hypothetical protein A2U01_0046678, partial [Trifolium medium]|nr:hypothetical protein [Trifolium medium]